MKVIGIRAIFNASQWQAGIRGYLASRRALLADQQVISSSVNRSISSMRASNNAITGVLARSMRAAKALIDFNSASQGIVGMQPQTADAVRKTSMAMRQYEDALGKTGKGSIKTEAQLKSTQKRLQDITKDWKGLTSVEGKEAEKQKTLNKDIAAGPITTKKWKLEDELSARQKELGRLTSDFTTKAAARMAAQQIQQQKAAAGVATSYGKTVDDVERWLKSTKGLSTYTSKATGTAQRLAKTVETLGNIGAKSFDGLSNGMVRFESGTIRAIERVDAGFTRLVIAIKNPIQTVELLRAGFTNVFNGIRARVEKLGPEIARALKGGLKDLPKLISTLPASIGSVIKEKLVIPISSSFKSVTTIISSFVKDSVKNLSALGITKPFEKLLVVIPKLSASFAPFLTMLKTSSIATWATDFSTLLKGTFESVIISMNKLPIVFGTVVKRLSNITAGASSLVGGIGAFFGQAGATLGGGVSRAMGSTMTALRKMRDMLDSFGRAAAASFDLLQIRALNTAQVISTSISHAFMSLKSVISNALGPIVGSVVSALSSMPARVKSAVIDPTAAAFSGMGTAIKTTVNQIKVDASVLSGAMQTAFSAIAIQARGLGAQIQSTFANIASSVAKTNFAQKFMAPMVSSVSSAVSTIKGHFSSVVTSARAAFSQIVPFAQSMATQVSQHFNAIKNVAFLTWSGQINTLPTLVKRYGAVVAAVKAVKAAQNTLIGGEAVIYRLAGSMSKLEAQSILASNGVAKVEDVYKKLSRTLRGRGFDQDTQKMIAGVQSEERQMLSLSHALERLSPKYKGLSKTVQENINNSKQHKNVVNTQIKTFMELLKATSKVHGNYGILLKSIKEQVKANKDAAKAIKEKGEAHKQDSKHTQDSVKYTKQLTASMQALSTAVGTLTGLLKLQAMQAFRKLNQEISKFVGEGLEYAARIDELDIGMQVIGVRARKSIPDLEAFVESVRDLGITANDAYEMTQEFVRYQLPLEKLIDFAKMMQDLSATEMRDISDVTTGVLRGITTGEERTLRFRDVIIDIEAEINQWALTNNRLVESITPYERAQVALNAVLQEGARIAGVYGAALERPAGALRQLKIEFQELRYDIMYMFLDSMNNLINYLREVVSYLRISMKEGGRLYGTFRKISAAITVLSEELIDTSLWTSQKIVEAIDGLSDKVYRTFMNIVHWGAQAARFFAEAFVATATASLNFGMSVISNVLSYWFEPHSPPKIAPHIDEWGAKTMEEYLKGFSMADYDILEETQNNLKRALEVFVSYEEMAKEDAQRIYLDLTMRMQKSLSEVGYFGEDVFSSLRGATRHYGEAITAIIKKQHDLQVQEEHVLKIEKALERTRKDYQNARKQVHSLVREYNAMVSSGATRLSLEKKVEDINKAAQRRSLREKQIEEQQDIIDREKERTDIMREQLQLQQKLLDQMISMAEYLAPEKEKAGGGAEDYIRLPQELDLAPFDISMLPSRVDEEFEKLKERFRLAWAEAIKPWTDYRDQLAQDMEALRKKADELWYAITGERRVTIQEVVSTDEYGNPAEVREYETFIRTGKRNLKTIMDEIGFWETLKLVLDEAWEQLWPYIKEKIGEIWAQIKDFFTQDPTGEEIVNDFGSFGERMGAGFYAGFVSELPNWMRRLLGDDTVAGNTLNEDVVETERRIAEGFNFEDIAIGTIVNTPANVMTPGLYPDPFGDEWPPMPDETTTNQRISRIGDSLVDGISAPIEDDSTFEDAIGDWAQRGIRRAESEFGVKSPSTVMLAMAKKVIEGFGIGLKDGLTLYIRPAMRTIQDAWDIRWRYLVTSTDNYLGDLRTKIRVRFEEIALSMKTLDMQPWQDLGKSIVNAMTDGVEDKADKLKDAVVKSINDSLDAADRALEIRSPSQVMREKGQAMMVGTALGVQDSQQAVYDAVASAFAPIAKMHAATLSYAAFGLPANTAPATSRTMNMNMGGVTIMNDMDMAIFETRIKRVVEREMRR